MKRPLILVVDDEQPMRETLKAILRDDYEVIAAKDGKAAIDIVKTRPVDMVLMDVNLPAIDGIKALEVIKEFDSDIGVVMLSAMDSAHKAVLALRKGAYDYITKPFDNDDLLLRLRKYTESMSLKKEVAYLKEEMQNSSGYSEIISVSPKMKKVFDLIDAVSRTSSNVLITGESGTGKELVARAIHSSGVRRGKPFVAVNCGAVPSELMESELFGHEKGAFTGAHAKKTGRFEYADGGVIFLDEISSLPFHLQVKLLRVLQEKSFERVGSNIPVKVDIMVIAATNVDLEAEVRKGNFREDLLYRLKVVPIEIPPLRERKEDIPLLVNHFLEKHSARCNKPVPGISNEVINAFRDYTWPGNVRELENLIERLVVLTKEGREIAYEDLPVSIFCADLYGKESQEAKDFREACRSFERNYILNVLKKTKWNRTEAAKELNVHRNTLLTKMKELDIKEPWLSEQ